MSKLFKNLKSLFVVEEEGKTTTSKTKPGSTPTKRPGNPKPQPPKQPKIHIPGTKGSVDEKFTNILLQALEKANKDGYDYLEFKNSLQSLAKMSMDEATRFKSAYTLAQTMNVTPQQLINSANYYLDVLKTEETKFGKAIHNQQTNNIQSKQQQIAEQQKAIKDKTEAIEILKKEIAEHESNIQKMNTEIQSAETKVGQAQSNFVASYEAIVQNIRSDVEKMKTYLK